MTNVIDAGNVEAGEAEMLRMAMVRSRWEGLVTNRDFTAAVFG